MSVSLYALLDPAEPREFRYIGIARDVQSRFRTHLRTAGNSPRETHKLNWLRKVILDGRLPAVKSLVMLEDGEATRIEQLAIAAYRKAGHRLTNLTEGGECTIFTPEAKARAAAAALIGNKNRWADPTAREKQSIAMKARHADPEYKSRVRAFNKAAQSRPDVRAKHAIVNADPEVKARRSAAAKARTANRKGGDGGWSRDVTGERREKLRMRNRRREN